MLWGIDAEQWGALWSGLLGSIPASVLAAFVAVYVLNRSNIQQRRLAANAVEAQRRRDAVSAEEATRRHHELLEEQRAALDREIIARHDEARREREYGAIGEIAATTQAFVFASNRQELDRAHAAFEIACMKFGLELRIFAVSMQMLAWPVKLHQAGLAHLDSQTKETLEARNAAIARVRTFCTSWFDIRERETDLLIHEVEQVLPGPLDMRGAK